MKHKWIAMWLAALLAGVCLSCGPKQDPGEPPTPEAAKALDDFTLQSLDAPVSTSRLLVVNRIAEMDPATAAKAIPKLEEMQKNDPDAEVRAAATAALEKLKK